MKHFPDNILCATSTRNDGNMAFRFGEDEGVLTARKHFLEVNDLSYDRCLPMQSDHHDLITIVDDNTPGIGAHSRDAALASDVLVTQCPNLVLLLTTADCQPVSLYDPKTQTIALAHISRHTLAQSLASKTVQFLQERFNTDPADLLINIGPYIHADSYMFPLPLPHVDPVMEPFIVEKDGMAHIDTRSASLDQFTSNGVAREHITISSIDTATSPEHFSYYVATRDKTPDGRMATILAMRA